MKKYFSFALLAIFCLATNAEAVVVRFTSSGTTSKGTEILSGKHQTFSQSNVFSNKDDCQKNCQTHCAAKNCMASLCLTSSKDETVSFMAPHWDYLLSSDPQKWAPLNSLSVVMNSDRPQTYLIRYNPSGGSDSLTVYTMDNQ